MAAIVNQDECSACGSCVDVCPSDAISLDGDVAVVNEEECNECGACVDECPSEAISLPE